MARITPYLFLTTLWLMIGITTTVFGFGFLEYFRTPKWTKEEDKIIAKYVDKMEQKELLLVGRGGLSGEKIKLVNLQFQSSLELSQQQARQLIIECTQDLLEDFNSNSKIGPYLHDVPFTHKNIELCLGFHKEGHRVALPCVGLIALENGIITYMWANEDLDNLDCKSGLEETYEEATILMQKHVSKTPYQKK